MSDPESGGVFISYRRQEFSGLTGRLYEYLRAQLGSNQVYMDVDRIGLGVDFAEDITRALHTCQALLAMIGPRWLTVTDEGGRRRLEDPDDIVCLEIETALERDIRVIPILIDGAVMPSRRDLPERLAKLAGRNAFTVRHESFRYDADRLLAEIELILQRAGAEARPAEREERTGFRRRKDQLARVPDEPTQPLDNGKRSYRKHLVQQPKAVQVLPHANQDVKAVVFSGDGLLLATGSEATARIWEVASGRERVPIPHDGRVESVAFSPDGSLLATACWDGEAAWFWDVTSGKKRGRIPHEGRVESVAFSPDGRLLATGSEVTAWVWYLTSELQCRRFPHDGWVRSVAFSPDGRLLATGGFDGTARVWDVASRAESATVTHGLEVRSVAFSRKGDLLASGSADGTAHLRTMTSGQEGARITPTLDMQTSVSSVAFSPDGSLLATGSADGKARLWEVASGDERVQIPHDGRVESVAFSPDGRLLATGSTDGWARLWALLE